MKNILFMLVILGHILLHAEPPERFRIENPDPGIIRFVEQNGGQVSRYLPGEMAELYLSPSLKATLQAQGIILHPVDQPAVRPGHLSTSTSIGTVYHGYEAVAAILDSLENAYPEVCRRYCIGKTVENRDILALKISDNPDLDEPEPEVKYISTMHGNEILGQELMLCLIDYLLQNYQVESRIENLLDSTTIWIVPNMNFDGTALNQRFNANGKDLNRNFPDREFDALSDTTGREPEIKAVMNWSTDHAFALGANFHCGVRVVNYPWDKNLYGSGYAATPDDDVFKRISLAYAENNASMFNSTVFDKGITNGATWYQIGGSMQDWNYNWLGCMEVTIELSEENMPDPALLPEYWEENRESLIHFLEQVHSGVKGIITDAESAEPLPASVRVQWRTSKVCSDPDFGDYYCLLEPGTYDLVFESEGYTPQIMEDVLITAERPLRLDVRLTRVVPGAVTGTILTEDGNPVKGAVVYCQGKTDTTGYDSRFLINDITPGSIHICAHAANYKTTIMDTALTEGDSLEIVLSLELGSNEYVHNFESDDGAFTANEGWEWGDVASGPGYAFSGSKVWGTVLNGNYPGNNALCYLQTPLYSLLGISYPLLEYYQWFEIEELYDGGNIKISTDEGRTWSIAVPAAGYSAPMLSGEFGNPLANQPGFTGRSNGWEKVELDLTTYAATPFIMLRFDFGSDKDKEFSGWYIDNVRIIDGNATWINSDPVMTKHSEITIFPNPANPGSVIRMVATGNTDIGITIFNSLGQRVVRRLPGTESEGRMTWTWDGKNDTGQPVSSGIYFIKFPFSSNPEYHKLLIIR